MQFTRSLLQALAIASISAAALAQATLPYTDGEVRKVDLSAQKITLKHGEIKNLDMPPMSMVFQVKDPALLEKVKTGDKVKFTAEQIGSALVVTDIQPAP
ncbi:Cu/Ag efflux protein CusF [Rhodoferax ferrireducens]|uniref:Cu/Ag efflux protein CusF n=1 Tax=Rhodoferax ferrireducens TaxID=192843 RepID=A0ABU2C6X9_9BURK|nr:copper-binding protein [Rhodoferax ferrireducens]MDR7377029.1 Cu/Ag efflux protein CusF [Rhodoferax ferrireducens]